jgi:hypothetical protein
VRCDHTLRLAWKIRWRRALGQELGDEPISLGDPLDLERRGLDSHLDSLEPLRESVLGSTKGAFVLHLEEAPEKPQGGDKGRRATGEHDGLERQDLGQCNASKGRV